MSQAALILVYNHRFDKNIETLELIYKDRFTHIFHLVPFYTGTKHNVIPVYESSFNFQGYFAQGLKSFFSEAFAHYLFVADDLLLNPAITELNYSTHFKLAESSSYLPEIFSLHNLTNNDTLRFEEFYNLKGELKYYWWRIRDAVGYAHEKEGVEIKKELPSYADAEQRLLAHGYPMKHVEYADVHGRFFPLSLLKKNKLTRAARHIYSVKSLSKTHTLSYPLVCSYSDIVIVSKDTIKEFCHYCGAFAANDLFVEFAVPTALLLASTDVVTEPKLGARGSIYWTYTEPEALNYEKAMAPFGYTLSRLMENFPPNSLYMHPVKLSKWKTQTQ